MNVFTGTYKEFDYDGYKILIGVETITPKKAKRIWQSRAPNRPISAGHLRKMKADIMTGQFDSNAVPLIFNKSGKLEDGGHRIQMIIATGKTKEMICIRGIKSSQLKYSMDQNAKGRSVGDWLAQNGEINCSCLAAALARLWFYVKMRRYSETGGTVSAKRWFNTRQASTLLNHHPNIRKYVALATKLWREEEPKLLGPGPIAYLWYIFAEIDEKKANKFFSILRDGMESEDKHPVYLLRRRLVRSAYATSISNRLTAEIKTRLVIMAWNCFVADNQMSHFRSALGSKFPVIRDENGKEFPITLEGKNSVK